MQAFSTQLFPASWLAYSSKVALVHVLKLEALDPWKSAPDLFSLHECHLIVQKKKTEEKTQKQNSNDLVKENYI